MKIITIILLMVSANIFAANISVSIKATADDNFVIVLSQGANHSVLYTATSTTWRDTIKTNIQVPNTNLKDCSIDFITYSHIGVQGLAGTIIGDAGTVLTGNPIITTSRAYAGGFITPTPAKINLIYSSIYSSSQRVYSPQNGLSPTWGAASNIGLPSAVNWISIPQGTATEYTIHRLPCGAVVKPGLIVNPGPFPRPNPTPAPIPNPGPLPVDVKGDHFACYMLEKGDNLKAEQITITDQFGSAKVVLGMPKMICNPSQKIHRRRRFPIENEKRHLVCYDILEQSPNKDYKLEIKNQFETRNVRSTNRELFCVPSLKKHL